MMKKWLSVGIAAGSLLTVTAYAMPIEMNLLGGGLSVLDSLFLIGVGLTLIGIFLLCIAFLKPQKVKVPYEETEDDAFLNSLIEDAVSQTVAEEEPEDSEAEPEEDEAIDAIQEESVAEEPEEVPADAKSQDDETDEDPTEEETAVEEDDTVIEEESEPEDTPEEKNFPTLTLTGLNNGEFKVFPLKECVTLGRRPDNDLIFSDTTVSGVHCEITVEDGTVYLCDKNSTNGTYLNGIKIAEKTAIKKGDVMVLGQLELKISL